MKYLESHTPRADEQTVLARYHYPEPRLSLGVALRGIASAAVDISDGLVADLGHILEASGVAASIDVTKLPLSAALKRLVGESAINLALNAGDDYELCVTISPNAWESLPEDTRSRLTIIGEVNAGHGLVLSSNGQSLASGAGGYDHFIT